MSARSARTSISSAASRFASPDFIAPPRACATFHVRSSVSLFTGALSPERFGIEEWHVVTTAQWCERLRRGVVGVRRRGFDGAEHDRRIGHAARHRAKCVLIGRDGNDTQRLMRPTVGLSPTKKFCGDGDNTGPDVSVPTLAAQNDTFVLTPDDEPPVPSTGLPSSTPSRGPRRADRGARPTDSCRSH